MNIKYKMLAGLLLAISVNMITCTDYLGYSPKSRPYVDSSKTMIMLTNIKQKSAINGKVNGFEIYSANTGRPLHLSIWKPIKDETYQYIGGVSITPRSVGYISVPVPSGQQISIQEGDVIGNSFMGTGGIVKFATLSKCNDHAKYRYVGNFPNPIPANKTIDFIKTTKATWYPCRYYSYRAVIEPCPAGTFSNRGTPVCAPCPVNTYQPHSGKTSCEQCPEGHITSGSGSKAHSDCIVDPDSVDRDPHFMMSSLSGDHMCFDFNGVQDEVVSLIDDQESDIFVNGQLFETASSTKEKPRSYFSDIVINTPHNIVKCSKDSIMINGDQYNWGELIDQDYDDLDVTNELNSTIISLNRLRFMVTRGVGDQVGYFLGFYIMDHEGLSHTATGLIGQFIYTDFKTHVIDENHENEGWLVFNDNHESVVAQSVKRFHKVAKSMVPCWLYKPEEPSRDILLGRRDNYIMKHLESRERLE